MDDDRLTLSPDHQPRRPEPRRRARGRWEDLDARLDEIAQDPRFDPYDRGLPAPGPRRRERAPRPVLGLFIVAAAAWAAAFAAAPLFAFRAVRSAAEYGDVQALSELVDYNAVRQSLRTQLRRASAERRPPVDLLHDPLGALRRAWEPVSPQADVDVYLGPDAIALLAEGRGPSPPGTRPQPAQGLFGGPVPAVRFWSTGRVRLGVRDPSQTSRETIFTFQRRKMFTWRLVGVRLPQTAAVAR